MRQLIAIYGDTFSTKWFLWKSIIPFSRIFFSSSDKPLRSTAR